MTGFFLFQLFWNNCLIVVSDLRQRASVDIEINQTVFIMIEIQHFDLGSINRYPPVSSRLDI